MSAKTVKGSIELGNKIRLRRKRPDHLQSKKLQAKPGSVSKPGADIRLENPSGMTK